MLMTLFVGYSPIDSDELELFLLENFFQTIKDCLVMREHYKFYVVFQQLKDILLG